LNDEKLGVDEIKKKKKTKKPSLKVLPFTIFVPAFGVHKLIRKYIVRAGYGV